REAELIRLLHDEVRRPFDLARGPLLRMLLVKLASDEHVLLCVQHHIITDGWSRRIFWRELAALYEARSTGTTPSLPALPIGYSDFAACQRQTADAGHLDQLLRYWRERLEGAPEELALPVDRRRGTQDRFPGAMLHRVVPKAVAERFATLARSERSTL